MLLFMHAPRTTHFQLLKRILRYLQGTSHYGLQLYTSPSHELIAYSDADWAGCPDTRKSTSGFCVFLRSNLVSWSSKRQPTVSRSSAEAEYRAVANCVAETTWLRQLFHELRRPPSRATVVYCDNISATYLSSNPVQHQRTKHVEIDLHFVRDRVALGEARVLHVPSGSQYADIFTKGLPSVIFIVFRASLNIHLGGVPTAGGVNMHVSVLYQCICTKPVVFCIAVVPALDLRITNHSPVVAYVPLLTGDVGALFFYILYSVTLSEYTTAAY